jgi:hypothetical protein
LDLLVVEPGGALDGFPVAWFAPNGRYFDDVWREALGRLGGVVSSVSREYDRLEFPNGGSVDFWTLHNTVNPGRGRRYSRVFVDEAAMVPDRVLGPAWTGGIRPTLTDFGGGAWFGSTPAGLNFFHELFQRGVSDDSRWGDWRSFQAPTVENPFISPSEVEAARVELDEATFRQEYLAEFVSDFGVLFKEPRWFDDGGVPVGRVASGCDFAYGARGGDYSVFVRGVAGRGRNRVGDDATLIFVTDVWRERGGPEVWGPVLGEFENPFALVGGQEDVVLDFVRREFGVTVRSERARGDKLARARPLQAAWNRGEVLLPRLAPWLGDVLGEMMSYSGNPRVDAHDDVVDAFAALHAALARPTMQLF